MSVTPCIDSRNSRPYRAIRARMPREALGAKVPGLLIELSGWMRAHRSAPDGPPLIRYREVDYNTGGVDVEAGFPVAADAPTGSGRVLTGTLPAGRYATLVHAGPYDRLMDTTALLLAWAEETGTRWAMREVDKVTTWECRVEHYLAGPPAILDSREWRTEVAILLAPA